MGDFYTTSSFHNEVGPTLCETPNWAGGAPHAILTKGDIPPIFNFSLAASVGPQLATDHVDAPLRQLRQDLGIQNDSAASALLSRARQRGVSELRVTRGEK